MNRGQSAKGGVVLDNNMPAQQNVVRHGDFIAEHAVVGDVAARHEQVIIADDGIPAPVPGPKVNGYTFANRIVVANEHPGVFAFEFFILGVRSNHRSRIDLVVFSKDRVSEEGDIVVQFTSVSNSAIGSDVGERSDLYIGCNFRRGMHNDMLSLQ